MSKISLRTKETIKEQTLKELEKNGFFTTSQLAGLLGRSWVFTEQILSELVSENKVELFRISQVKAWKLKK